MSAQGQVVEKLATTLRTLRERINRLDASLEDLLKQRDDTQKRIDDYKFELEWYQKKTKERTPE